MEELKLAAKKAVGTKAVLRAMAAREAARVYVATDIDTFLYQKITRACEEAGVPMRKAESSRALGRECGLTIGCAAAAVLK